MSHPTDDQLFAIARGVLDEGDMYDHEVRQDIAKGTWYIHIARAAYAAGHSAGREAGLAEKLDAKQNRKIADAVEKAVDEAVNDWVSGLSDLKRLSDLLERQPNAPILSEEPFARRNELEAILLAACELAEVDA